MSIPMRLLLCIFLSFSFLVFVVGEESDLYKLLGVDRTSSTQEIKKAYRRKALDTHPDKNKNVPAEEAAAAFQKVVHAFEILSDASSRKRYDRTGRSDDPGGMGGGGAGGRQREWTFRWNTNQRRPKPKLKDRFDVKEAQSRILHIVSLAQLELIITTESDENDDLVLERNLLICFYTPQLETLVMEEMVYPWPFAAMSTQGIWWEDLLQTTVVRYHKSNELTEFFGVPKGEYLESPVFLFGKRGQKFRDAGAWSRRLTTNDRKVFDNWLWEQLQVEITFVNKHDHPVEMYWINERRAIDRGIIGSNEKRNLTTMLSHEWWFRDARTDTRKDSPGRYKLTEQTCLYNVKITSDTRIEYAIPKRDCYDLSGHCPFWNQRGRECSRNPVFMHEACAVTCNRCEKDDSEDDPREDDATRDGEKNNNNDKDEERESSSKDEL